MRHWSRFDTFLDAPNLQDVSERSWLLPKPKLRFCCQRAIEEQM